MFFFWNSLAFSMIQWMFAIYSGSSALSKTNLNMWKITVHVLLKPAWRILNITLLTCEMSAIVRYFEHSLGLE